MKIFVSKYGESELAENLIFKGGNKQRLRLSLSVHI